MSFSLLSNHDNDENCIDSINTEIVTVQKSLIYQHPLFPVLAHVLERCEQATGNPLLLNEKNDSETSSFEENFKIFLSKNNQILTTTCINNESSSVINQFYIDAMQVLRIHLLELEKLNDLCQDFCQRYIACLKVKLNVNNIFTDDEDDESEDFESNIDEDNDLSNENEEDSTPNQHALKAQFHSKQTISTNDGNFVCNQYLTQFNGQTPLSQIMMSGPSSIIDSSSFLFDTVSTKQRKQSTVISSTSRRGVLPKSATSIMRNWLFQHITHPYPNEDEKRAISIKTNLSLLQVNNWFINARRRILQPMLETSNPYLVTMKKKKRQETKSDDSHLYKHCRQISYLNRYWPSNFVQYDTNKK